MNRKSKTFKCPHSKEQVFGDNIMVYCRRCKLELRSQEDIKEQENIAQKIVSNGEGVTTEKIQRLLEKNK